MLNINPAYAGNEAGDHITSLYRKQWIKIEGAPTTYSLSWDKGNQETGDGLYAKSNPMGYGVQIYNDCVGIESNLGIQAFYSYRIKMNNTFVSFGVSGGLSNYIARYTQVVLENGQDPSFQTDVNTYLPTAGVGVLYGSKRWYVGLSVPALLQTNVVYNKYQVTTGENCHYFLNGGYVFDANNELTIKPSVLLKVVKGQRLQYDINFNTWIHNTVGLGLSYRVDDAIVGMFELHVTPTIVFGYAYDYMISSIKGFSSGTHELILKFDLKGSRNKNVISPRYY